MQGLISGTLSKLASPAGRTWVVPSRVAVVAGLLAPAGWLLAGCGSGADLMSTVVLPSEQSAGSAGGVAMGESPESGPQPATLELTPAQRGYLDALSEAGVYPPSQLRALSIGSYICQARAAGQSLQAVRDYVAPMVRSDVADAVASAPQSASVIAVDAAIDDYIRIAGQRLC